MILPVPEEYEQFVSDCLASGHYPSEMEFARAAIATLERERFLAEIDVGIVQLDRGEYTEYGPEDKEKFIADILAGSERLRKLSPPS